MTVDHARKHEELERLLNDPDVPLQPARVWSLLAELKDLARPGPAAEPPPARLLH